MIQINSYLTFNGNCREAMTFYQECFGGELYFQTIGDSPMPDQMPPRFREYILHASLRKDKLLILASDMVAEKGLIKGNSISLLLNCNSEEEIMKYHNKLSSGGETTHPLEISFWGALFGDLIDKYGNQWLLHYDKTQNN